MTELPIVVNMTVDASRTEYDLTAESNLEEIELLNDTVIETGGSHVPVYDGPYTVDAGLNAVTLDTDGKRLTQDVTVNALTENYISANQISVNSSGVISSLVSVSAGYSPNVFAQMFYKQLDTQARKTVTPTASEQTAVSRGKYTTGDVKVRAIPAGTRGTPTATKGAVSNHSVSVTPSVTNTTGYIEGGTKNGTAVSVSASELVSGSLSITTNNTYDVTNYASAVVNVSGGVTPTGTINITTNGTYDVTNYASADVSVSGFTTGTFTPTSNTGNVTINTGLSSITACLIVPLENPYVVNNAMTIYGSWHIPDGVYQKALCVRGKGSTGRGFEQWISSTPPHTVNGGTIVISYPNRSSTGYFTPVTYRWYAW